MPLSPKPTLRLFLVGLLLMTCIFCILYHPYLFGGHLYAYEDIGSDTIHQYLPTYALELEQLRQGGDGYSLIAGLGKYNAGLLTKYLNPLNLPLLLCGGEHLHVGILLCTYLRYGLIFLFALLYFLRMLKEPKAALIPALLWTFSGYNVLWSQHYHFLACMACFTACMYSFQLYLEEDRKGILVVLALAFLLGCSYYFTYISLWFFAVYGVFYLISQRKPALYIFKRVALFALLAVLSALMSLSGWLPSVVSFLESSRTEQVSGTFAGGGLFYPGRTLLSFAARLLGTNLLGIADSYTGNANYYEAPVLFVSALFLFSLAYLLLSRHWKKTLAVTLVCVLLLCMPLTSRLLVFSEDSHRWTYLLSFLQALTVGLALKTFLSEPLCKKRALLSVLLADILLLLLAGGVLVYHLTVDPWLSKQACLLLALTVGAIHLLLLFKGDLRQLLLLALVVLELTAVQYPTVNQRNTVSLSQWRTSLYNDGTEKALAWLEAHDSSLYRVAKTYHSVSMADSAAQGYAGTGVYSSTNSAHLLSLARFWGYEGGNWVSFHGTDRVVNDLLGVKYVISLSSEDYSAAMALLYDDGTFRIWENTDWSGFGYLCTERMADPGALTTNPCRRSILLTRACFPTGGDGAAPSQAGIRSVDLLPLLTETYDCQVTGEGGILTITTTGADAQLVFSVPGSDAELTAEVYLEMDSLSGGILQLFTATETESYSGDRSCTTTYGEGGLSRQFDLPSQEAVLLRLDPATVSGQTLSLRRLELRLIDRQLLSAQQKAQRSSVTGLTQQESSFTGTVTNPGQTEATLCLPLIYSPFWKAEIDGAPLSAENINGGLTGIAVPAGTHSFTLTYDSSLFTAAKWLSGLSLAVYLGAVILRLHPKKREK